MLSFIQNEVTVSKRTKMKFLAPENNASTEVRTVLMFRLGVEPTPLICWLGEVSVLFAPGDLVVRSIELFSALKGISRAR